MFVGFASDNTAGAHPRILDAVVRANSGYCKPYGADEYSDQMRDVFHGIFGDDTEVFLALSGTGANVLCLRAMLRPWQGVICADVAHINTDESGAPEWVCGSKVLPVPSIDGKMTPDSIDAYLPDIDNCHHSTPHVLSITQSTEKGSVYTRDEICALTEKAHKHGLFVHMDGTRLANAVASLESKGESIRSLTRDAGIDALSFGGTKNGLMLAEAVVLFNTSFADDFLTMRKQSLQLASKMRFLAAQFIEALDGGTHCLWLENARQANLMARKLADSLRSIPYMQVREPQANAVFVSMPPHYIAQLQQQFYFYETTPAIHETRLMCSFATTDAEIEAFAAAAQALA